MPQPFIKTISPNPVLLGQKVTITGSNFTGASAVNFGKVGCVPGTFQVNAAGTQIVAAVPPFAASTQFPAQFSVQVIVPGQVPSNAVKVTVENPPVINTITIQNNSGLDTSKYTVWVAGFMEQPVGQSVYFLFLQSKGTFSKQKGSQTAGFINVNNGLTIQVPNVTNLGNNRLVFVVTPKGTTPTAITPGAGYTAYPFNDAPGVCPPGPYDIFEFGPMAQYDVSAVDSFGLNLSFTVTNDPLTYGTVPAVSRGQIGKAFAAFVKNDPLGKGFGQLLYSSPALPGYPILINNQFSAIVSPKDWLAIYPKAKNLANYWNATTAAFFAKGNQLNFQLNAANAGNYQGTSDGTKYTLTGPGGMQITIPASDFSGNQGFIQSVRSQKKGESKLAYETFGQIEAAIFEAFSRGVALDGVVAKGKKISTNYSSKAWTNSANWFTNHPNAYNQQPSVYDVYAKFFHFGTFTNGKKVSQNIFGLNAAGTFGMAYGFSLDETPNVGTWPANANVPAKTTYNVGFQQNVTINIGPW